MDLLLFLLALFLFVFLVIIHEYGHFLVAKRNKVEVLEFGLGLPPRLCGRTLGRGIFRSYYSINWLPLGGFVRLKGEYDDSKEAGGYGAASLWVKTKIILAGVTINFLFAVCLFTILAWVGIPRLLPLPGVVDEEQFTIASDTRIVRQEVVVNRVLPGSPAERAGLQADDIILGLAGQPVPDSRFISDNIAGFQAQTVSIEFIDRQTGQPREALVSLNSRQEVEAHNRQVADCLESGGTDCGEATGYLGVATSDFVLQASTWSAPIVGFGLAVQFSKVTLEVIATSLASLVFQGDATVLKDSVGGPVAIIASLRLAAESGFHLVLMLIALLSLTLAIMNSLPIPALDGGRLALTVLFNKILKKRLTKRLEARIVGSSMVMLVVIILLVTVLDLQRI